MGDVAEFRQIASWEGGRASVGPSWGRFAATAATRCRRVADSAREHVVDGARRECLLYPDAPPCEALAGR